MREEIRLKTSIDVARIRKSSRVIEKIFYELSPLMRPGTHVGKIVEKGTEVIHACGAVSAIQGFKSFPAPLCVSINHVAAHGIPQDQYLSEGDVVSVDSAVDVDGWYSDGAWTYLVGEGDVIKKRLIKAAWQATRAGILQSRALRRIGDIGNAVTKVAKKYGVTVLKGFTGHGIGYELHEPPNIPFFGERDTGGPIVPGMVFTIEPIVALGDGEIKTLLDNWTVVTANGELTAHFEHTLAVFGDHTEVLTLNEDLFSDSMEYPPY